MSKTLPRFVSLSSAQNDVQSNLLLATVVGSCFQQHIRRCLFVAFYVEQLSDCIVEPIVHTACADHVSLLPQVFGGIRICRRAFSCLGLWGGVPPLGGGVNHTALQTAII